MWKTFLALATLFCAVQAAVAEGFSKGDQVELVRPAPLYFKETYLIRVGTVGERFTVLMEKTGQQRVFLSSRDALGNEVALSISKDALRLVTQPGTSPERGANISVTMMARAISQNMPATMAARMSFEARSEALRMNGGKKESDEAVLRGLRWLVQNQNPDGSWGRRGTTGAAMTGFSILSLLGHGETTDSAEFGPAVKKALDWLVTNGNTYDSRLSMEQSFTQAGTYAHAIVTFALGEYYTLTKDARVVDLLKKAVGYIVAGQGPDGGWMYSYDRSTPGDTSVSGWQIQALKAAHLSGLNIDGVDAALDKAMLNLARVRGKTGGFGYRTSTVEKYSLTGVGVFCTYIWKQEKDKLVHDGIDYIIDHATKKDFKDTYFPVEYKGEKADLYAWYYNTQACFMYGGQAWDTWNSRLQDELVTNQSPDGSWPAMPGKSVVSYQTTPAGDGPIYRTNFCILMLEVYYRYLPTGDIRFSRPQK